MPFTLLRFYVHVLWLRYVPECLHIAIEHIRIESKVLYLVIGVLVNVPQRTSNVQ